MTAVVVMALVISVASSTAALIGDAFEGVTIDAATELVVDVVPASAGWAAGIRADQTIDEFFPSDSGQGWSIRTHDSSGKYRISEAQAGSELAGFVPLALLGLVLGFGALLFLRTHRRWALPAAAVSLLAAAVPLQLQGSAIPSTVALGMAALVPAGAYIARIPTTRRLRWVRWSATVALVGFLAAWAYGRLTGNPATVELEGQRSWLAFYAALALIVERVAVPLVTSQSLGVLRPRLIDLVIVSGAAIVAITLASSQQVDINIVVLVLVAIAAIVPATRARFGRPIEEMLLADIREQAAAEATERERARLARELHDVPMQELAAVIKRLEIKPGTEAESESLRALAGHLRNVATELRPPVLDDLGLPAALEYLAEGSTTEDVPVTVQIDDETGIATDVRPPTDVELAMYRIASEAVANALRHSGGSRVAIGGAVAQDRVELIVSDNGAGLAAGAARDAAKRKRLGLTSMRRRAEAIDAELSIDATNQGTRVRVVWQA